MNSARLGLAARPLRGLAFVLLVGWAGAAPAEERTVELVPPDRPGWHPANLLAPLAGLVRGDPDYYYEPRSLQITTTPPGGLLDLFYVRQNLQKRYEQAAAPVRVRLPRRIDAGPRDGVRIRALLDGYRPAEVHVPVRSEQEVVEILLEPLPNVLRALRHASLAGRATLDFVTGEALAFRVQQADDGLRLILPETSPAPDLGPALEAAPGRLVDAVTAQQLGEDLVVGIALSDAARREGVEARSRQSFDPVRQVHHFALDLVPADAGASGRRAARAALRRIRAADVGGCAAVWDRRLRQELDPAALARALAPRGEFTDPYLRAAMRRLGELAPDGAVRLADGSRYRVAAPIELAAAASQAHEALGYLALLRRFVAELERPEHRSESLRGLLAPELSRPAFEAAVGAADGAEASCEEQAP